MKIAVIAANGRSGKIFVTAALGAGHTVRAGVYGTQDLEPHENLEVLTCDGTDIDQVRALVAGQDAAVSLIGHGKKSPKFVQSDTITNLISAIGSSDTKLVSLTGTGARVDGDKPSMLDRFLNMGIKLADPNRINDGLRHVEILAASNINWTIVRVLKLTNGPVQKFSLNEGGPAQNFTSRNTVAHAILEIISDDVWLKKLPVITKI